MEALTSQSSQAQMRMVTRNYLKGMPVWDYFDKFKLELESLKQSLDGYISRQDTLLTQASYLPELNLTNTAKDPLPPKNTIEPTDQVRVYKLVNNEYKHYNPTIVDITNESIDKDESIAMLSSIISQGEEVFALLNPKDYWTRCTVKYVVKKPNRDGRRGPVTRFRLLPPSNVNMKHVDLDKYSVARIQFHEGKLRPPKRVIGGSSESKLKSGLIAMEPTEENKNRYLVLLDDGSAEYCKPELVFPIVGQTPFPWLDGRITKTLSKDTDLYLRYYLTKVYPARPLMLVAIGKEIEMLRKGELVKAKVVKFDCDTMVVKYPGQNEEEETIHRSSLRVQLCHLEAAKNEAINGRSALDMFYPKLLFYAQKYHEAGRKSVREDINQMTENFCRITVSGSCKRKNKTTARKSSTKPRMKVFLEEDSASSSSNGNKQQIDNENSRDEEEEVRTHICTPMCLHAKRGPDNKSELDVKDLKEDYRKISDLRVPLLLGWRRYLKIQRSNKTDKSHIVYMTPCDKTFKLAYKLRMYLIRTESILDIDYFSFEEDINLYEKNPSQEGYYFEDNIAIDAVTKLPLENKNISVINQFNSGRMPLDFEYRNETFPHPMLLTRGFSFNHEFKSGCDCKDDCSKRQDCPCHLLNCDFAGYPNCINKQHFATYNYRDKRLVHQVPTGIFECNSFCQCSSKCTNRVVQNGIRYRLQVQYIPRKGWGVVTRDDIPKGAFISTYSAELLDDADQYGNSDMYYADLDYISVNQNNKYGYHDSDIVEIVDSYSEAEASDSRSNTPTDSDFSIDVEGDDDSDDRRARTRGRADIGRRQLRRRAAQPRFRPIQDILGIDEYTLDARMQGNVGRFYNHSCDPNAFVQNVFIETHDLRFPEVAFFANRTIRAMEEITWDYNYKMGSIEGRELTCHCGAANCRGRIL